MVVFVDDYMNSFYEALFNFFIVFYSFHFLCFFVANQGNGVLFNVYIVFFYIFLTFYLMCAEVSTFMHACEGDAVTKLTNEKIPYFNAPIYLQNMTQIGKVDEIFGPINESVSFSCFFVFKHFG